MKYLSPRTHLAIIWTSCQKHPIVLPQTQVEMSCIPVKTSDFGRHEQGWKLFEQFLTTCHNIWFCCHKHKWRLPNKMSDLRLKIQHCFFLTKNAVKLPVVSHVQTLKCHLEQWSLACQPCWLHHHPPPSDMSQVINMTCERDMTHF